MMYLKRVLANGCAVLVRRGCAGGFCAGFCGIMGVVRGLGRVAFRIQNSLRHHHGENLRKAMTINENQ